MGLRLSVGLLDRQQQAPKKKKIVEVSEQNRVGKYPKMVANYYYGYVNSLKQPLVPKRID